MTKKLLTLSFIFLFICLHASAQEDLWRKPGQLKANISLVGANVNYELRLLKYATLNLEGGIEMGASYSNSSYLGEEWEFSLYPVFSAEFRQYYGIARRAERNKRIDNNAGNFFSFTGGYQGRPIAATDDYSPRGTAFFTPAWGMQRSWGRHFSFEGRFGVAFIPDDGYGYYDPVNLSIRIGVGYVIL